MKLAFIGTIGFISLLIIAAALRDWWMLAGVILSPFFIEMVPRVKI